MFDKVKELMQVQEQIETIKEKTDANTRVAEDFSKQLEEVKSQLSSLIDEQKGYTEQFKENVQFFSNLREDLGKEIYDFKLLKSQLQQKILTKFEEELSRELKMNVDTISKDMSSYEEVKAKVGDMMSKAQMSTEEMGKWLDISSQVKKSDFELNKFAHQLQKADSEKLELMKKIDNLERLVSKMRRSQPQQMRR